MAGEHLQSWSDRWLDWLTGLLVERSDGLLTAERVLDDRAISLVAEVKKALSKGLGYCAVVSMAGATPIDDSKDNVVHELECEVTVFRNAALCKVDTRVLAEALYASFVAAYFEPVSGIGSPTVTAGGFRAEADDLLVSHSFRLKWRAKVGSNA